MDIGMMELKLDNNAKMPQQAHEWDAGFDLFTPRAFVLEPNSSITINTGVHVNIPQGYGGFIMSKSGLNVKFGITSEGVIDAGYTGAINVKLYNNSKGRYKFEAGDKITQIVFMPVARPHFVLVDGFEETERGENGFGSSGR